MPVYDRLVAQGAVPATATYQQINFSANIQLTWNTEPQQQNNQFYVTSNIDLVPSEELLIVKLPSSQNQGIGTNFVLNNITNFKVLIHTDDDQFLFEISPQDAATPNAMYIYVIAHDLDELSNWRYRVQGSSSNVNDITQSLGNGLQVGVTQEGTEILTVKHNSAPIEQILSPMSGATDPTFIITADASALDSNGTTAIVTDTLGGQVIVMLDYSFTLATRYGYAMDFINLSNTPLVFMTQVNDTINGLANESAIGGKYASLVIQPRESCQLLATENNGWSISVTNSLISKTFRTTNINVNSAQINQINGDYWIDFSHSLDVALSTILVVTGSWDNTRYPISAGQGLYLVMPNELSTLYYLTSQLSGYTNFKIGLGVRLSDSDIYLETALGKQMSATPQGSVGFTYICYRSNSQQITDISPLSIDIGTIQPLPAGVIMCSAMVMPPSGWLLCDGAELSRTLYSTLFQAIGTTFGAGDGINTFNIPDLRGEFVRGWDSSGSVDPDRTFGSKQLSENKQHTHSFTGNAHTHTATWTDTVGHIHTDAGHSHSYNFRDNILNQSGSNTGCWVGTLAQSTGTGYAQIKRSYVNNQQAIAVNVQSATATGSIGNTGTSEARPVNIALNYIIKI